MARAIITFPRINNINVIEQLRSKYDPLAIVPAHITLVFPFDSQKSKRALQRDVEISTHGIKPFDVELRNITGCEGEYLFLNVTSGKNELINLHERLYSGILLGKGAFLEKGFVPHITIGRIQDKSAFLRALQEVQQVETTFHGFIEEITACHMDGSFEKEFSVHL